MRDKVKYTCNDCGTQEVFTSYKKARAASWALSKDYKDCYCPNCAPDHRRGGANKDGKSNVETWQPPRGFEQLGIENLK